MAHAASVSPDSVRSTPPLGSLAPSFPAPAYDEDSQVKVRAGYHAPEGWYEEDPFPLVRERDIEITFDDSSFEQALRPMERAPAREPSMDWRGIPAGSLAEEPPPPSTAFDHDARGARVRGQRLSARAIATRLVFGAILCGIVILLGYECHVLWQTGTLPF